MNVEIPAQQVDAGEGQVLGANHDGDEEVPENSGYGPESERRTHHDAVAAEEAVVGIGLDQVSRRGQSSSRISSA